MDTAITTASTKKISAQDYVAGMKKLGASMESAIKKGCGAVIEVTARTEHSALTLSGDAAQVDAAVAFVTSALGWKLESQVDDTEIGERFAYILTA